MGWKIRKRKCTCTDNRYGHGTSCIYLSGMLWLEGTRGYWKMKQETLDRTLVRTRFGVGLWTCRKTDYRMNG
jgi:hypothetical protein